MNRKFINLVSSNFLNTFLAGILGIYVARAIGPEDKGLLAIIIGTIAVFANTLNFGIAHAGAFYVRNKRSYKKIQKLTHFNLFIVLILCLPILLAGNNLFSQLFLDGFSISNSLLVIVIGQIIITSYNLSLSAYLISLGDTKSYGYGLNTGTIITSLLTFILFYFYKVSLTNCLLSSLVGQAYSSLYYHRSYQKYIKGNEENNLSGKEFYNFGMKSYLGVTSSFVFKRLDLYVLGFFLTTRDIGIYSVALSLRDLALIVPRALGGLVGGQLADSTVTKNLDDKRKITKKTIILLTVITCLLAIGGIILFPLIIPLFYGEAYNESVSVTSVLFLSLPPISIYILLGSFLNSFGKPLYLSYTNIIAAVVAFVTLIYLTKNMGIIGASINAVLSASLLLLIVIVFYNLAIKKYKNIESRYEKNTDLY